MKFRSYDEKLTEEQIEQYVLEAFREFRKDVKEGRLPKLSRICLHSDSTGTVESTTYFRQSGVVVEGYPHAREQEVEGHGTVFQGHRLQLDLSVQKVVVLSDRCLDDEPEWKEEKEET